MAAKRKKTKSRKTLRALGGFYEEFMPELKAAQSNLYSPKNCSRAKMHLNEAWDLLNHYTGNSPRRGMPMMYAKWERVKEELSKKCKR